MSDAYGRTVTTHSGAVLDIGYSPLGGEYRAVCRECKVAIVGWDSVDELREHECEQEDEHEYDAT